MYPNEPEVGGTEALGAGASDSAASQPMEASASDVNPSGADVQPNGDAPMTGTLPAPVPDAPVQSDMPTGNGDEDMVLTPASDMADDAMTPDSASSDPTSDDAVVTDQQDQADSSPAPSLQQDQGDDAGSSDEDEDDSPVIPDGPPTPGRPRRGDVIQGVIIETTPTSIRVDLGGGAVGIVTSRELDKMGPKSVATLKVGETLPVYVVNPNGQDGVLLSINRAAEEMDWQMADQYRVSQEVYDAKIAGYNKGGLIVRFGRLRGFVPTSQLASEHRPPEGASQDEFFNPMVNGQLLVKVIEVDRPKNRLILSERTATRESREKRKENLISQLTVGEIRTGSVVSLEDFGAFVDIGGAEGLVHLTEITWKHINHPRDVLRKGQQVTVEVINVDPQAKRIGLSMKSQEMDPWDTVATTFQVGQLVQATITKLTKFGAFAKLVDLPEIEGLVHISELDERRVNHPKEVVNEEDRLTLRVVKIEVKARRLGLSLKRVNSPEYLDFDLASYSIDDEGNASGPGAGSIPSTSYRAPSIDVPTAMDSADLDSAPDASQSFADDAPNAGERNADDAATALDNVPDDVLNAAAMDDIDTSSVGESMDDSYRGVPAPTADSLPNAQIPSDVDDSLSGDTPITDESVVDELADASAPDADESFSSSDGLSAADAPSESAPDADESFSGDDAPSDETDRAVGDDLPYTDDQS